MAYRWNLLAPRLDPYLQAGYQSPIIALDNVPWDLSATPKEGDFGNLSPPRDYGEWGAFIQPQAKWNAQIVTLTDANSVYSQIKADLAQNKLLLPEYAAHPLLADVATMSLPGGKQFVQQNFAKYEAMMVDSLTLKPFTGTLQPGAGGVAVGFAAVPGSVTAITFDPAR